LAPRLRGLSVPRVQHQHAFSPTDVPVLSRRAKLMMMMQSLISLATVALLAAGAVNIL
jgi:hypothetical protein